MTSDMATHTLAGGIIAIGMFALGFIVGAGGVYIFRYIRMLREERCSEPNQNYHDDIPPAPLKPSRRTMWD